MSDFLLFPANGAGVGQPSHALADQLSHDGFAEARVESEYRLFVRGGLATASNGGLLLMGDAYDADGGQIHQSALDEIVRDHLNEQLLKLWARTEKTIAFVTHSIPEAVYLSTKIVVMSPRPGRIADVIESPLPRERPLEIRETPEFLEIAHRVREGLRAGHGDD